MGLFEPSVDAVAVAELADVEVEVLADLARVLVAMLRGVEGDDAAAVDPETTGAADSPATALAAMVGIDDRAQRPENPALARLLPDGYRDDEPAAADFRRFTQADLRARKMADAQAVLDDLEAGRHDEQAPLDGATVRLDAARARTWLGALNDMRLALGTSLGVTEDLPRLRRDDPRGPLLDIYDWLTGLQATLIETLEPRPS